VGSNPTPAAKCDCLKMTRSEAKAYLFTVMALAAAVGIYALGYHFGELAALKELLR
jgi:hypothetical protein